MDLNAKFIKLYRLKSNDWRIIPLLYTHARDLLTECKNAGAELVNGTFYIKDNDKTRELVYAPKNYYISCYLEDNNEFCVTTSDHAIFVSELDIPGDVIKIMLSEKVLYDSGDYGFVIDFPKLMLKYAAETNNQ